MNLMPFLQKVIGVLAASTCCATFTALLFWGPTYADTTSGFLGPARSWSGPAAVVGFAVGCILGAMIGVVVVLSGAGRLTGVLIGTVAITPVAVWFYGESNGWGYTASGVLLLPAGAVVGVVASLAPSWSGGAWLSSSPLLTTILAVVLGAPLILLVIAFGMGATKTFVARNAYRNAHRIHQETVAMLDDAQVEVLAKNVRVVSDDGRNVLAEVTLEINNIPSSIPYYEMNVHVVGQADSYFIGVNRVTNQSIPNPYLRVTNANGNWLFHDIFTDQAISDDAQNVTLQFEFTRSKAASNELPDTITPRLGIWAREDKVYSSGYIFFYKPIRVSFRRAEECE